MFCLCQVTISAQSSSVLENSDSEGTDTRDETDDVPLNGDGDAARNKIKIYRTISNVSSEKSVVEVNSFQVNECCMYVCLLYCCQILP